MQGKIPKLTPPLPPRPQILRMSVFSQNPHSSSSETTSVYHKLSSREYWINFTSKKICQSKPSWSPSALEMLNEPICPWNSRGVLPRVGGRAEAPSRHARRGPSEACLSEIDLNDLPDLTAWPVEVPEAIPKPLLDLQSVPGPLLGKGTQRPVRHSPCPLRKTAA